MMMIKKCSHSDPKSVVVRSRIANACTQMFDLPASCQELERYEARRVGAGPEKPLLVR